MCAFKKLQLNPAHRAAVFVCAENASAKIQRTESAPGFSDSISTGLSNASHNLGFRHGCWRCRDTAQQGDFRRDCPGIVKRLEILSICADEIRLEGYYQFAGVLAVRGKSVSDGGLQRCTTNLKRGREAKVGAMPAIIKS